MNLKKECPLCGEKISWKTVEKMSRFIATGTHFCSWANGESILRVKTRKVDTNKCANPECDNIIGVLARPSKYCSERRTACRMAAKRFREKKK